MSEESAAAPKSGLAIWAVSGTVALVMLIGGAVAFTSGSNQSEQGNPAANQTITPGSSTTSAPGRSESPTPGPAETPPVTDPTADPGTAGDPLDPTDPDSLAPGGSDSGDTYPGQAGRAPGEPGTGDMPPVAGRDPGAVIAAEDARPTTPPAAETDTTTPGDGGSVPAPDGGGLVIVPGDGGPTTGPGDGGPTTGPGDGGPTTGPGDGGPTTGPGDGGPTTGPGDGEPTSEPTPSPEPTPSTEPTPTVSPTPTPSPSATPSQPQRFVNTTAAWTDAARSGLRLAVDAPRAAGVYELTVSIGDESVTASVTVEGARDVSVSGAGFTASGNHLQTTLTPADFGLTDPAFAADSDVRLSATNTRGQTPVSVAPIKWVDAPDAGESPESGADSGSESDPANTDDSGQDRPGSDPAVVGGPPTGGSSTRRSNTPRRRS